MTAQKTPVERRRDKVIALRLHGQSCVSIAEQLDISIANVYTYLRFRPVGCSLTPLQRAREQRRERAVDLRVQGFSYHAIGKRLGISAQTAWRDINRAVPELQDTNPLRVTQLKRNIQRFSLPIRREKVADLRRQGLSYDAIGRQLGISKSTAFTDGRRMRISPTYIPEWSPLLLQTITQMAEANPDQTLLPRQVAPRLPFPRSVRQVRRAMAHLADTGHLIRIGQRGGYRLPRSGAQRRVR